MPAPLQLLVWVRHLSWQVSGPDKHVYFLEKKVWAEYRVLSGPEKNRLVLQFPISGPDICLAQKKLYTCSQIDVSCLVKKA